MFSIFLAQTDRSPFHCTSNAYIFGIIINISAPIYLDSVQCLAHKEIRIVNKDESLLLGKRQIIQIKRLTCIGSIVLHRFFLLYLIHSKTRKHRTFTAEQGTLVLRILYILILASKSTLCQLTFSILTGMQLGILLVVLNPLTHQEILSRELFVIYIFSF